MAKGPKELTAGPGRYVRRCSAQPHIFVPIPKHTDGTESMSSVDQARAMAAQLKRSRKAQKRLTAINTQETNNGI